MTKEQNNLINHQPPQPIHHHTRQRLPHKRPNHFRKPPAAAKKPHHPASSFHKKQLLKQQHANHRFGPEKSPSSRQKFVSNSLAGERLRDEKRPNRPTGRRPSSSFGANKSKLPLPPPPSRKIKRERLSVSEGPRSTNLRVRNNEAEVEGSRDGGSAGRRPPATVGGEKEARPPQDDRKRPAQLKLRIPNVNNIRYTYKYYNKNTYVCILNPHMT